MTTGRINQVAIFPVTDRPQPKHLTELEHATGTVDPKLCSAPKHRAQLGQIKLRVQIVSKQLGIPVTTRLSARNL